VKKLVFVATGAPGSTNDRIIATCIRESELFGYSYILLDNRKYSVWSWTKYRRNIVKTISSDLVDALSELADEFGELIFVPIGETTTRRVLSAKKKGLLPNILLSDFDLDKYELLGNKSTSAKLSKKAGFLVPASYDLSEINKKNKSYYLKPKKEINEGFKKAKPPVLVSNEYEIQDYLKDSSFEDYFLQEAIDGDSYYLCVIINKGNIECSFSQMNILQEPKGGSIISCYPTDDVPQNVLNACSEISFITNWSGPLMIEFKVNQEGWYLIEINPRFWGPIQITQDNGTYFLAEYCKLIVNTNSKKNIQHFRNESIGYKNNAGFFRGSPDEIGAIKSNQKFRDPICRADTLPIFFAACITNIIKYFIR